MHSMAFHGGVSETILFTGWQTTDWNGMSGSMVGIILLTIIFEGLKSYRDHLFKGTANLRKKMKKTRTQMLFSVVHILQVSLHVIQMIIGYFLMLIFMTYNVWLCIAMVIGTGLGYWLFAWDKSDETSRRRVEEEGPRKIPSSSRQIILGWDRFNSITLVILIVLFIIWCLAYFLGYQPKNGDDNDGGHGAGDNGHGNHSAHGR